MLLKKRDETGGVTQWYKLCLVCTGFQVGSQAPKISGKTKGIEDKEDEEEEEKCNSKILIKVHLADEDLEICADSPSWTSAAWKLLCAVSSNFFFYLGGISFSTCSLEHRAFAFGLLQI